MKPPENDRGVNEENISLRDPLEEARNRELLKWLSWNLLNLSILQCNICNQCASITMASFGFIPYSKIVNNNRFNSEVAFLFVFKFAN